MESRSLDLPVDTATDSKTKLAYTFNGKDNIQNYDIWRISLLILVFGPNGWWKVTDRKKTSGGYF